MTDAAPLDALVAAAGRTHVIPSREDPALLERLRDPAVLQRATELLAAPERVARLRAVLCIERVGYVLRDQETATLLLAHAAAAADPNEAMTTLEALRRCAPPRPLAAAPLLALAARPEWRVRNGAIRCLHLAPAEDVEAALLELVGVEGPARADVAFELRFLASERSLAALVALLDDPTLDVRTIALDSIGERTGAGVLPHARRLAGRSGDEQVWAEKWIARFGEASDVPFMAHRLALVPGRGRTMYPPEVASLVPFLGEHANEPAAAAALARLRADASRLPESERDWLAAHAPELLR